MSEPASISTGIAERYATAVYDLAREANQVDAIEGDLTALEAALNDSDDFRRLTTSPLYTREEQEQAIKVLAEKMGLTKTQSEKLTKSLASAIGKDVKLNATVDEAIIGGLVVKVGSKMIDTSIRSKLNSLQNTMKEVG